MPDTHIPPPYLSDRAQFGAATDLILQFGTHAAAEAEARAGASRSVGNYVHFCRWRQVGRLIDWLATGRATGTVH